MLLPRDLVKYQSKSSLDPFAPGAEGLLRGDPEANQLIMEAEKTGLGPETILLALRSLKIAATTASKAGAAEFVATVPPGVSCPARPTPVVIREMLAKACREIIALGYEISDKGVISMLHEAALVCPQITIICDRERGSASRLASTWPTDRFPVTCYENRGAENLPTFSSMHCKTLLVDGSDLLITSANFTFHGMGGNMEFGIRLQGDQAGASRPALMSLLNSGHFQKLETGGQN